MIERRRQNRYPGTPRQKAVWFGATVVVLIAIAGVAVLWRTGATTTEPLHATTQPSVTTAPDDGTERTEPTEDMLGSWVLVGGSVDGQEIPTRPDLVLRVDEDRFWFPLACNSASVPYETNGASIDFVGDGFERTDEGCSSEQAELFEMALRRVRTVSVDVSGERLTLEAPEVDLQFAAGDM